MKKALLAAVSALVLAVPTASAEVDPGFGVEAPRPIEVDPGFGVDPDGVDPGFGVDQRPIQVLRRNGINPIARILLFPIIPFVEAQAALSPEKASCWNDRAGEVVGCSVVEQVETAQERRREALNERWENRPTPYVQ